MAPRSTTAPTPATPPTPTRREVLRFLMVKLIAVKNNFSSTTTHNNINSISNTSHNEDDPPGIDFATLGAEIYSLSKHSLLVLPSELRREYFRLMLKYSNGRLSSSRGGQSRSSRGVGGAGGKSGGISSVIGKYTSPSTKDEDSSNDSEDEVDGSSEASSSLDVGSNVGGHLGNDDGLLFPPSSSSGGGLSAGRQSGLTWNRVQRHVLICAAVPIHATGVKRSRDSSSNRALKSGRHTLEERIQNYMSALRHASSGDSLEDDHNATGTSSSGGGIASQGGLKYEGDDHSNVSMAVDNDPLLKTHFFSPTIQGGSKAMSDSQRRLLLGLAIPVPVDVLLAASPLGDSLPKKGAGGHGGVKGGAKGAGGVSGTASLGGIGRGGGGGGGENPNVLLAVLDQCETLQGADIFRHRVDVGTIMNHSGAQLGPYSTVVKVPMCLDIIREAIVTNTSLRQVVGAAQRGQSLKQQLKKEEVAGSGGGVVKQEKNTDDDSGPQGHTLPPHLFKQASNNRTTITQSGTTSDSPTQKKQGTTSTSSTPASTPAAGGLSEDNFSISTLGDLRRCIWLIAANCSVFNAPEGPFPEKGRQFARRCCVVIDERAQRLANDYLDERGL